ncbi:hypothetical protein ACU8M5_10720 [Rhizobium leguminosarum]
MIELNADRPAASLSFPDLKVSLKAAPACGWNLHEVSAKPNSDRAFNIFDFRRRHGGGVPLQMNGDGVLLLHAAVRIVNSEAFKRLPEPTAFYSVYSVVIVFMF